MIPTRTQRFILLFVVGTTSVLPTLWGDFVFDDGEAIVKNSDVVDQTWNWSNVVKIFKHDFWGVAISHRLSHKSYRPLTTLSYRFDYYLWGHNPLPFHLIDLVIHGINCVLVYLFLNKCLQPTTYANVSCSKVKSLSFWGALLFSAHPVHVEPLGAVVGRADLLASLIFLCAFYFIGDIKSCAGTLLLSFTTVFGALFKETAIALSVFIILLEVIAGFNDSTIRKIKNTLGRHLIILAISGGFVLWRLWLQDGPPVFQSYDNPPAFATPTFAKISSIVYIWVLNCFLLLSPIWLCYDWSMGCVQLITSCWDLRFPIVVLFCVVCLRLAHLTLKNRIIRISALIFASTFLPSSNILFTVGFVLAERNLYLPSIGYCLFIAYTFIRLDQKKLLVFLISIFYLRSLQRSLDWVNQAALFKSALNVCPDNAKVHYNLGTLYGETGNHSFAERSYQNALSLRPDYYQAMNNLGNLLRVSRRFDEAEIWLRKAVEIKHDFAAAWMNLGIILSSKNQSEALSCYLNALKFRKSYPDCEYNLGNLVSPCFTFICSIKYLDIGKKEAALLAWRRATKIKPTHSQAWINSVILLEQDGRLSEAKETAMKALSILKTDDTLHFILGNVLGKLSEFESAKFNFEKAIKLRTDVNKVIPPKYYSNLGVLYHRWGKKDKAIETYQLALTMDPNLSSTKKNLEMLLKL